MKANNYRIGNYILFNESEHQMTCNDIMNLYESELINKVPSKSYSDIPLRRMWLEEFGFTEGNQCYQDAFSFNVLDTDFYLRPSFTGGYYWGFNESDVKLDCELNNVRPLRYVHELQNLFFAITGIELKLKNKP